MRPDGECETCGPAGSGLAVLLVVGDGPGLGARAGEMMRRSRQT